MEQEDIEEIVEHKIRMLDWILITTVLLTLGIVFFSISELFATIIIAFTIITMYIMFGFKAIKFIIKKFTKKQLKDLPYIIIILSIGVGFGIGVLFCAIYITLGL